jgi:FkbM family methyltransferase
MGLAKSLGRYMKNTGLDRGFQYIPEGALKFRLRELELKLFGSMTKKTLANQGDTVVHAGLWKIETINQWASAVGESGELLVIEANPTLSNLLKQEVELRELENVTVVNKAVWNSESMITFAIDDNPHLSAVNDLDVELQGKAAAGPATPDGSAAEVVEVPADTVDSIVADESIGDVDILYSTVNGADIRMLKGAERTLSNRGIRVQLKIANEDASKLVDSDSRPLLQQVVELLEDTGLRTITGVNRVYAEKKVS